MNIRVTAYDTALHGQLVDIWERAVRATHHFLTEEDIDFYRTVVRGEALLANVVWIAIGAEGQAVGFIGLANSHVEMLFVDPVFHGQGIGKKLIQHAIGQVGPDISVDVNEQNEPAVLFYKRLGFKQVGRSDLDGSGRPFPLLHMKMISE
ncbi:acetyltransferase [Cohnella boryungensis]|uniref:Acetyltransferase n=1 Tax=Cohnella boryungensis TaxID=768479 RepID=A0ABV8SH98_9BACL